MASKSYAEIWALTGFVPWSADADELAVYPELRALAERLEADEFPSYSPVAEGSDEYDRFLKPFVEAGLLDPDDTPNGAFELRDPSETPGWLVFGLSETEFYLFDLVNKNLYYDDSEGFSAASYDPDMTCEAAPRAAESPEFLAALAKIRW